MLRTIIGTALAALVLIGVVFASDPEVERRQTSRLTEIMTRPHGKLAPPDAVETALVPGGPATNQWRVASRVAAVEPSTKPELARVSPSGRVSPYAASTQNADLNAGKAPKANVGPVGARAPLLPERHPDAGPERRAAIIAVRKERVRRQLELADRRRSLRAQRRRLADRSNQRRRQITYNQRQQRRVRTLSAPQPRRQNWQRRILHDFRYD